MKIYKSLLFGALLCMMLSSCATYIMTTQNLQKTLENKPSTGNIRLNVIDKNGKDVIITPTIHTSIRITKSDNTRQQFYFITIALKDSTITGSKSAIFNMPIKPIKVSEIKKIELDGR